MVIIIGTFKDIAVGANKYSSDGYVCERFFAPTRANVRLNFIKYLFSFLVFHIIPVIPEIRIYGQIVY